MIYLLIVFTIILKFLVVLTSLVPTLSDDFIQSINRERHTWKAGRNFAANTSMALIRRLAGTRFDDLYFSMMSAEDYDPVSDIPKNFDSRKKWRKCPSINEVRNQGTCANCWAIAAVSTMTDRLCIYSNASYHFHFSSSDLHTCCINYGCSIGGYASIAWQYWKQFGIVSGGEYNSKEGCKPYKFPPCNYHMNCGNKTVLTPDCLHRCRPGFKTPYKKDKRFGKNVFAIKGGEEQIKAEIYERGPVQAVLKVFTDFLVYKKGIYRRVNGTYLGSHSVKIIGWGVDYGHNYWLAVNTWGKEWGDEGLFKIIRGINHCEIESLILAGEPLYGNQEKPATRINLNRLKRFKIEFEWPR